MIDEQELQRRLDQISRVFDIRGLAKHGQDATDIIAYYRKSSWGYRILHSRQGAMHMALNPNGVFDREGYYGQAQAVDHWLTPTTAAVLELASGNGFNTRYLASQHPGVKFTGVDIVPTEVKFARAKSVGLSNLTFGVGSFQELPFADSSFDLTFVIESLCHATDMNQALAEAFRVLRPGGSFIVIDAWRTSIYDQLSPLVQSASEMTQKAMAVGHPWNLDCWLRAARETGFAEEKDVDLTSAIMPNLYRFEHMAARYFAHPRLARLGKHLLPVRLLENAIAGYLMPLTVSAGAHTYRMIALRRP